MAVSILAAVQRIKAEIADWLAPEVIRELCQTLGYSWRERLLDPATTIHLFVLQVLHGNTACAQAPRLGDVRCTGEANYANACDAKEMQLNFVPFSYRTYKSYRTYGTYSDPALLVNQIHQTVCLVYRMMFPC